MVDSDKSKIFHTDCKTLYKYSNQSNTYKIYYDQPPGLIDKSFPRINNIYFQNSYFKLLHMIQSKTASDAFLTAKFEKTQSIKALEIAS